MYYALIDILAFLFVDTKIYFAAMALGILFWTEYVAAYLENENIFQKLFLISGKVFFFIVLATTIVNIFLPIMFYFDAEGNYQTLIARYIILIVQIVLLLLTAIYALIVSIRATDSSKKRRHLTISISGVIMCIFISIQVFEPLLPLYAIGYMMGCCVIRTFIVEAEKDEYRQDLEISLQREKERAIERDNARKLAYTDGLTGTLSQLAYVEKQKEIDKKIASSTQDDFSVIIFDVNNLKQVNDNLGHDIGDEYIIKASKMISTIFNTTIYRVGGDEFVALLEGDVFNNRHELLERFNRQIDQNKTDKKLIIISAGMADYNPGHDYSCIRVFERADLEIYKRKKELKGL